MKQIRFSFTRWIIPLIIVVNVVFLIIQFTLPLSIWLIQISEITTIVLLVVFLLKIRKKAETFKAAALEQIFQDSLTNLPTRQKLELDYQNPHYECSLAFGDVDNFKFINDSLGHKIGDSLLKEIARLLQDTIQSGTVYRWGGDEFVVLFPTTNQAIIANDLDKVMNQFKKHIQIDDLKLHISMSFGVVVDTFSRDSDLSNLLRFADIAMYDVKHKGKSAYEFYDPSTNYKVLNLIEYDQITKNMNFYHDTVLYYQPRFNFSSNEMVGLEVLIRINNKDNHYLPPGFISAAERNGKIRELDYSVIKRALSFQADLKSKGYSISLAINVSGATFNHQLLSFLQQQFQFYQTDPSSIELEITESVSIFIDNNMLDLFQQLKKMGINILLDDFGKKYSSLENISKLPIDYIKIDHDFIGNIHLSNVRKIIQSIIQLAKSMQILVIAEGIETKEQYNLLKDMGCDIFQGFLFERPIDKQTLIDKYFSTKER